MAIFLDMIGTHVEVFMDDFSMFGTSYDECLHNLGLVLKRCVETNLELNWKKCHFEVQQGIILGHKISSKGLQVDKAKVGVIENLPPPISVKGVRSFLGHAADWNEPFEMMCDASDYAVGAVFGQRKQNIFYMVYYAGKTLDDSQLNYTTIEKELLVEVKALPTNDAKVVINFLHKQLFTRFGTSRVIISDEGSHFCNHKFTTLMEKYHMNHHIAIAYHPQTIEKTEVSNREIKRILEKVVSPSRTYWSLKPDEAVWAYRTTFKTPLSMSSFQLVYGKECHLPAELEHKTYWALKKLNLDMEAAREKECFNLMNSRSFDYRLMRITKCTNSRDCIIRD
ncbi:uncharacterized protein LOC141664607 [Apium graveolens]|uniref:uncharacterized protein LOC141664607 n=1 Tax=Apium graveolens TaxID=4045 RepID=UPI003D792DE0